MCNPLMQAEILRDKEVEFCVTVGLCVGHDALFTGASTMPVSCLVAKIGCWRIILWGRPIPATGGTSWASIRLSKYKLRLTKLPQRKQCRLCLLLAGRFCYYKGVGRYCDKAGKIY